MPVPSAGSPGVMKKERGGGAGDRSSSCFISGSWEGKCEMCHLEQRWTAGEKGRGTGRKGE